MDWHILLTKQNKCDPVFSGHNLITILHFIHEHK